MDNANRIAELEKELSKQTALAQNGQSAIDTNRRLVKVIVALQSRHKEAMELLEVAVEIIEPNCDDCKHHKNVGDRYTCLSDRPCIDCHWQYFVWQHADRYEALMAKENGGDTPHADPIEAGTTGADTVKDIEPIE